MYSQENRRGDQRKFTDYSKEYNFNRPFFEQFEELLHVVPQPNVTTNYTLDENSEYTNFA